MENLNGTKYYFHVFVLYRAYPELTRYARKSSHNVLFLFMQLVSLAAMYGVLAFVDVRGRYEYL